jgi:hypothetical protein
MTESFRDTGKNGDIGKYSIHLALASVSQQDPASFIKQVKNEFYENRAKERKENFRLDKDDVIYKPLCYYLLGNYDLAFISIIDNFKFAHRLFEPLQGESSGPHAFQCYCGLSLGQNAESENVINKNLNKGKYFLAVCNLKLNNGLLIGNGNDLLDITVDLIKSSLDKFSADLDYLVSYSFSCFEITLYLFVDVSSKLSDIILEIRRLKLSSVEEPKKENIILHSLYYELEQTELSQLSKGDRDKKFNSVSLLSDTQTYFGIHSDLIELDNQDEYVSNAMKIDLVTELEIQVKPGHYRDFINKIEKDKMLKETFKFDIRRMIIGKSDYLLEGKSKKLSDNIIFLKKLFGNKLQDGVNSDSLFQDIRKIRTKVIFKCNLDMMDGGGSNSNRFNLINHLEKLTIAKDRLTNVNRWLKELKVARQMRFKVLKIFTNFNNGIQDVILFPFFLDFYWFIDSLYLFIQDSHNQMIKAPEKMGIKGGFLLDYPYSVNKLESDLTNWITVFQEGYRVRILNGYQFEDIIDFDLDFNSSVQQLLSSYSTMCNEMGRMFYSKDTNNHFAPIILLNDKDTQSNYLSINYAVHHFTSPEFIYATVTKEILNRIDVDSEKIKNLVRGEQFKGMLEHTSENLHSTIFDSLIQDGIISMKYFAVDSIRFVLTYGMKYQLYEYWFWSYNFQNSSLFDNLGLMNEEQFKSELVRLLFLRNFFQIDDETEPMKCPLPELFTYWDRHFSTLNRIVKLFFTELNNFKVNYEKEKASYLKAFRLELFDFMKAFFAEQTLPNRWDSRGRIELRDDIVKIFGLESEVGIAKVCNYLLLLESGQDEVVDTKESIGMFYRMHRYLVNLADKNHGRVSVLGRNWKSNEPMLPSAKFSGLYMVDQIGGVFFDSVANQQEYYQNGCREIMHICDRAGKMKKRQIQFIINDHG